MAFNKFIKDFDTVIHFNGNSFDIPFLTERGKKYNLEFDFDNYQSIDIYKPVSKLNHILKMENNKQKSFEKLLGINRSDPFSGGDLIEVFKLMWNLKMNVYYSHFFYIIKKMFGIWVF